MLLQLEEDMKKLQETVTKLEENSKNEWTFPNDTMLALHKNEFRNIYHWASDFVNENDLFGENKYMNKKPGINSELNM